MPKGFNLTANLVLKGPTNVKPVVAAIRRELGNIQANVSLKFDPRATRNVSNLNKNVNTLITSLNNLTVSANNAQGALNALDATVSAFGRANANSAKNITVTNKALKQTQTQAGQAAVSIEKFGKDAALAVKRFAAYSLATAGIFGFINAVRKAVGEAISFQDQVVRIGQVTKSSTDSLQGLIKEVGRLAKGLGVSSSELIGVAQILAQAGLSADDTRIALEALAKSTVAPTFKDIENTTEGAIAAIAQFQIKTRDLEATLGSINSVAASFAVESEDLVSVIRRAGGAFAAASAGVGDFGSQSERGVRQLQELSALFTSVRATTRESADSIATGLRTIFTRVQRRSTIDFLKEFNIQLEESGKFVGVFEAFKRISQGLSGLDTRDIRFSSIIEELGGFRQVSKVIPLIKNFETAQNALNVAIAGQDSLNDDVARSQESLARQIAKTRERFLEFIRDLSQTSTFTVISQGVLKLANSFIALGEFLKPVLPLLTALAAIKGFKAIQQFSSGFFGTFKGVSVNQIGQGLGNSVANVGNSKLVNDRLTTTLGTLNTTLLSVNNALRELIATIRTSNLAGGVRKFARGGLVPGRGNSDSVPAMLMPGEFVIRKKAVEAIGAQKLFEANRFALGGRILDQNTVGAAILRGNVKDSQTISINEVLAGSKKTERPQLETLLAGKTGFTLKRDSLDKTARTLFNNIIDKGIISGLNRGIAKFSGDLGISNPALSGKVNTRNFLASINDASRGNFFENVLSVLQNNGQFDTVDDPKRPFDFRNGLSNVISKGYFSSLSGINYIDAKASTAGANKENLAKKIRNEILLQSGISLAGTAKNNELNNDDILRLRQNPNNAKGNLSLSDVQRITGKKVSAADIKSFQRIRGKYKFASGGSISDIVPALLTPGEFVINREAAKRLGSGTLNRLNRADKVQGFNRGGFVGMQSGGFPEDRFPFPGPVRLDSLSGRQTLAVITALEQELAKMGIVGEQAQQILREINQAYIESSTNGKKYINVQKTLQIREQQIADVREKSSGLGGTVISTRTADQINQDFIQNQSTSPRTFRDRLALVSRQEEAALLSTGSTGAQIQQLKSQRLQNRLSGASIVAGSLTSLIPTDNIASAATAGGISGGINTGFTAGALGFGPLGIGIAAAVGAINGLITSIDDFNKQKAIKEFSEALQGSSDALTELANGVNSQNTNLFNIRSNTAVGAGLNKFETESNTVAASIARILGGDVGQGRIGDKTFGNRSRGFGAGGIEPILQDTLNFGTNRGKILAARGLTGLSQTVFSGKGLQELSEDVDRDAVRNFGQALSEPAKQIRQALEAGLDPKTIQANQKLAIASQDLSFQLEARKAISAGTVGNVAEFAQTDFGASLVENSFNQVNDAVQKAIAAENATADALNRLNAQIDTTVKEFNVFTARINLSTQNLQAEIGLRKNRRDLTSFNTIDTRSTSRALSDINALNAKELEQAIFSSPGVRQDSRLTEAGGQVIQAKRATDVLSTFFKGLNTADLKDTENLSSRARAELRNRNIDVNSPIISGILDSIAEKAGNRQDGGDVEALRSFLNEDVIKQIGAGAEAQLNTIRAQVEKEAIIREEIIKAQEEYRDAIVNLTNQTASVNRLRAENNLKKLQLGGGPSASLGQLNAGFNAELSTLTGTSDINRISNTFKQLQDGLQKGLITRTPQVAAKLINLRTALEKAANGTDLYSNAITKLQEQQQKTNLVRGGLNTIAFGSPEEVANFGRGLALTERIRAGGAIGFQDVSVFGAQRDANIERIRLLEGGDAARKFEVQSLSAVLRAQGVGAGGVKQAEDLLKAQFAEEDKLKADAAKALDAQVLAANTLLSGATIFADAVRKDLIRVQNTPIGLNSGGLIPGGGPNRDSVLAHLTPGEFVVNRNATKRHFGLLQQINGYNTGGVVSGGTNVVGMSEIMLNRFADGISKFAAGVERLSQISIPERITVEIAPIQNIVTLAGGSVLAQEIGNQITQQIRDIARDEIGKMINPLTGQNNDGLG